MVSDVASLRGLVPGHGQAAAAAVLERPQPGLRPTGPGQRRWLYQIVLREASRPEDLTGYLDRDTLIAVWPELHLPKGVRQAWEEHHPQLGAASPGTA